MRKGVRSETQQRTHSAYFFAQRTDRFPKMHFVGTLGALAAWRMTKGIYRFDKTVMDSLIETKIDGELPVDVLFKLPEWCIYIETPGMNYAEKNSHGMFVYLEEDVQSKRPELRFVFLLDDSEMPTIQAIIHLHKATLNECLGSVAGAIKMNMIAKGHFDTSAMDIYPKQAMIIEPFYHWYCTFVLKTLR